MTTFGRQRSLSVLLLTMSLALQSTLATAAPGAANEQRARKEFRAGQRHAELGHFEEAIQAFERAYELKPLPALLFNIGQCYKYLSNFEKAVYFFESYLREAPAAPDRNVVQKELLEARKRLTATESAPVAPALPADSATAATAPIAPPPAVTTPPQSWWQTWWFWTAVGSVAVVAAGTTTYLLTREGPERVDPSGTLGTVDARR